MGQISKRQKILYICLAAAFLLLAVGLLAFLLRGGGRARETDGAESTPPPTLAATAEPAPAGLSIAGKPVEPDTDSFDLTGRSLSEEDKAAIAGLDRLTTLSLTNCSLEELGFLSGLSGLRTLYLRDNRVVDVSPLAQLKQLRTLYLDNNPVGDLTPLGALENLTTLSLQGIPIADYALDDLQAALPGCRIFSDSITDELRTVRVGEAVFTEDVEVLDLSQQGIRDISKLSYCRQLRDLNLEGNPLESVSVLSSLPKLTAVNLRRTGLREEDLELLTTLQRLTYLNVEGNDVMSAEWLDRLREALPDCQIVHDRVYYTLELGGQRLRSDATEIDLPTRGIGSIEGLERFTGLRRLRLYGNGVTDLSPLRELRALEVLELGYNNITDISPLAGHAALRRVDLSHNAIQELHGLEDCLVLETLDLSFNRISELSPLFGCTSLRQVDLRGNDPLSADQIRRLQSVLPWCQILTDVDLSMPEPTPELPEETPLPG